MPTPNESPEQIEDEIRGTRRDIDRTLDALQSKLSPGQLLDQALTYVKDGGGDFASNLGGTVSRNPVPVALLGIGLTWLMCAGQGVAPAEPDRPARRRSNGDYGAAGNRDTDETAFEDRSGERNYYSDSSSAGVGDAVERSVGSMREGVRDARAAAAGYAETIGETAEEMASRMREGLHDARDTATGYARAVGGAASDMADRTGAYAQRAWNQGARAKDSAARMFEDYPVLVGVLGLAAGAVAAAVLPPTRREDKLMGKAADNLKRSTTEALKQTAEQAADAVQNAAEHPESSTGSEAVASAGRPEDRSAEYDERQQSGPH